MNLGLTVGLDYVTDNSSVGLRFKQASLRVLAVNSCRPLVLEEQETVSGKKYHYYTHSEGEPDDALHPQSTQFPSKTGPGETRLLCVDTRSVLKGDIARTNANWEEDPSGIVP